MKSLVITIALLSLPMPSIAQKIALKICIVPINTPDEVVEVKFNGAQLSLTKSDWRAPSAFFPAKNADRIRKAILAVPTKQWNGYWASRNYLDGFILSASLVLDGQKFEFRGMNGCPPKFSPVLAAIYEATNEPLFTGRWEEMEKSAKRYENSDAFYRNATPPANTKKD